MELSTDLVIDRTNHNAVKCVYFKESGKYYAEGTCLVRLDLVTQLIYPKELGKWLRTNKKLPGLQGGGWDGSFTIEVEGAYTELVPASTTGLLK